MERIALLPGGFKPPHAGHYNMAIWLAENTDANKVIVKVGAKERDGITREISLQLWDLFLKNDPNSNSQKITVVASNSNSPVQDVYDFVENEAPEESTIFL
jgi:nicotinic acid mononucleotide adenylyltransferase